MNRLAPYGLDAPLDPARHQHDLARGTVHDASGNRLVALSTPFLQSLLEVLAQETGDGWKIALAQAGEAWGRELSTDVERTLATNGRSPAEGAPLEAHLAFLEGFFQQHGWGTLTLNLDDTAQHGLIVARLAGSVVLAAQPALPDRQLDALAAGLLAGYFSALSGRELGCTEIACMASGAAECLFVISSPERLAAIDGLVDQLPATELIAALRTPAS
jgi:predicted hydrocarbon binding protein